MKSENVRASDFQEAWPHAYLLAMEQVACLQRNSDYIASILKICLDRCDDLSELIVKLNEDTVRRLHNQLQTQATRNEKLLELAVSDLKSERQQRAMERAEANEVLVKAMKDIESQKKELAKCERSFMSLPVLKRTWLIFGGVNPFRKPRSTSH